jgi:elongation factor Tu
VEDVFSLAARGVVVTGRVERGRIKVGDAVELVGIHETRTTVITRIEMSRKSVDEATPGENIGALLQGVARDDVARGQVLATPGSIAAHTKFEAEIVLSEGQLVPGYRPQFFFRTTGVPGVVTLPAGVEETGPGDPVIVEVELIVPIAMEKGLHFDIHEGERPVGAGTVLETTD